MLEVRVVQLLTRAIREDSPVVSQFDARDGGLIHQKAMVCQGTHRFQLGIGGQDRGGLDFSYSSGTTFIEIHRVLRNKSLKMGAVVSREVVVQAGAIVLTAGELIRVPVALARGRRRSERLIRVVRLDRAGAVGQHQRAAEHVGQEAPRPDRIGALEDLIDTQPGQ